MSCNNFPYMQSHQLGHVFNPSSNYAISEIPTLLYRGKVVCYYLNMFLQAYWSDYYACCYLLPFFILSEDKYLIFSNNKSILCDSSQALLPKCVRQLKTMLNYSNNSGACCYMYVSAKLHQVEGFLNKEQNPATELQLVSGCLSFNVFPSKCIHGFIDRKLLHHNFLLSQSVFVCFGFYFLHFCKFKLEHYMAMYIIDSSKKYRENRQITSESVEQYNVPLNYIIT